MSQFQQVFFEECFEGLEAMESGLLNLDIGNIDSEVINTIFRGAHSIKGGSGTFGFFGVADFTHVMETLLDEMRDGRRKVTQTAIDVLLGSVDCLREMLTSIQHEQNVEEISVAKYKQALEIELYGAAGVRASTLPSENNSKKEKAEVKILSDDKAVELSQQGWKIAFCPYLDLLKTGNDPVRMFRELAELGELITLANVQDVPGFYELDPEECNIAWDLKVLGESPLAEIKEIFNWVEGDCELDIQPLVVKSAKPALVVNKAADAEPVITLADKPASAPGINADIIPDTPATVPQHKREETKSAIKASSSIRVDTAKIDALINMVGEVVITQSMLGLVGENFAMEKVGQLKKGLAQLERHTRDLQQGVMNIRMLPISFVFSRFPRLVHDISTKLGKKIELKLVGEQTEVDKAVVELINDPLVHLIRNSLDHGIEMPAERIAAGKPETGTIELKAYHRGGHIVIEITDDGHGLDKKKLIAKAVEKGLIEENSIFTDKQAFELIFMPGFSTAEQLTDISGRGVGMDVVRKNIQSLGGNIEIISELGKGTTIAIHLPLTLAILDGQSVAVGDETYIVPLVSIIESINITEKMLNKVAGKGETFRLRNQYIPIIRMHEIFNVRSVNREKTTEGILVIVEGQGILCGLLVDDLLGQQQVVIKSLEANYRRIEGVSGATILGDGSVALILDVPGLMRFSNR
ncbi:fused chemotactic sensory histidine kinase in two-component regulatory system with CheB and CheY: sensory histidine kinase; signal sensing protein [Candidatus Methylobacter favarea]|uniref:Chemotaxis protein CheA n=1 Tax=Candidatus Methylobacter favarea TaxID=2707345 RepID=A0A8S0X3B5_9GAMM|nr:chemotaxis protein CheA [Candidatus Methylobacter favarea]CAA9892594.1 fused chemotactic sensory histidine kinase in two-component regulatory system with CheB and CheY: sensory histidine kinase; signal sensing protein [Candidatus Methylobacter favarea]